MKFIFVLLTATIAISCQNNVNSQSKSKPVVDSGFLKVSEKQTDVAPNEWMKDQLKPIQDNFKRINAIPIHAWSLVFNKDFEEEGEGAVASFYFYNNHLEKIIITAYGETGQRLTEYYLLNGQLSFVFSKEAIYNRPVYYDSTKMKENKDSVVFNIQQSEVEEDRSYFKDNKLLHQLNNQDCGAPFAADYLLEEQERILADFNKLIEMSKEK